MKPKTSLLATLTILTAALGAQAQEEAAHSASGVGDGTRAAAGAGGDETQGAAGAAATSQLDVELDPLAFAASGFSVHAGWRIEHFRFDVGAFGAELPSFVVSSDAFSSRFAGFGVKCDYHLNDSVGGAFFGVAASRVTNTVVHEATALSDVRTLHEVSARVGYEFDLAWGLYVVPWVSVGTFLGAKDVTIDGDTLEAQGPISVFPTLHLGYRL